MCFECLVVATGKVSHPDRWMKKKLKKCFPFPTSLGKCQPQVPLHQWGAWHVAANSLESLAWVLVYLNTYRGGNSKNLSSIDSFIQITKFARQYQGFFSLVLGFFGFEMITCRFCKNMRFYLPFPWFDSRLPLRLSLGVVNIHPLTYAANWRIHEGHRSIEAFGQCWTLHKWGSRISLHIGLSTSYYVINCMLILDWIR